MIYRKLKDNSTYTYSDGRLIICSDGRVIANPSADTLAEEGWEEYTPPVVEPGPQLTPGIDELLAAPCRRHGDCHAGRRSGGGGGTVPDVGIRNRDDRGDRDSVNPLYYPISQLINHYFHTVE